MPNSNNNQITPSTPSQKPNVTQATNSQTNPSTDNSELRININTASKAELCKLKGIGEVKADAIIAYREANNGFKNIDEIKNVSGIGDATFNDISPYIYVENPPIDSKININTANLTQLQKITGVGPAIAQRIIDYRNENGDFQSIEDIINVKGIGEITFEKMKDQIVV